MLDFCLTQKSSWNFEWLTLSNEFILNGFNELLSQLMEPYDNNYKDNVDRYVK